MERKNVVTVKGNAVTLLGEEVKAGQKAPDFKILADDLSERSLGSFPKKIKLIASVPSLDTPVCDLEIKRFNTEAAKIAQNVEIIFVSMDLPFAQKRFCQAFSIEHVRALSDHRDTSFGTNYGVLIKELRLLARAIFIIDSTGVVRYVEYVKELTSPPNYEAALEALKKVS
ncbi:MAG: thiol peroxidase [Candidatus Omnitrophica bacterium]|nr:thiol peroxidase [Candidatus Omnitrophota bacterium]MDD5671955.1 thiol peroxidase [Candidatus Omnitrophota bacterium]